MTSTNGVRGGVYNGRALSADKLLEMQMKGVKKSTNFADVVSGLSPLPASSTHFQDLAL